MAQAFLVSRDGKVVGRILAIVNHGHNRRYDELRGFFGFYECADDEPASTLLFETACQWLREQGMQSVRGPANPSLNYECGTLVDGFDSPPTFMITYNPPYHDKLITAAGFEKSEDLYSYNAHVSVLDDLNPKLVFILEEVKRRFGVVCRPLNPKQLKSDVRIFLEIYNRSLEGTWGYVPMSEAEIDHQANGLKHLLVPEVTSIAEIDGAPVCAGFGLLDYNPIIKKIGGRLFPFGWIRLFTERKKLTARPIDQHQCAARISEVGPGTGDARTYRSRRDRLWDYRRGVLLGAGKQQIIAQHDPARWCHENENASPL